MVSYVQCGVIIGVNLPAVPLTYESFIPPYPPAPAPRTGFARPSRRHLRDLNTVLLTEHRQSRQDMTVSPVREQPVSVMRKYSSLILLHILQTLNHECSYLREVYLLQFSVYELLNNQMAVLTIFLFIFQRFFPFFGN